MVWNFFNTPLERRIIYDKDIVRGRFLTSNWSSQTVCARIATHFGAASIIQDVIGRTVQHHVCPLRAALTRFCRICDFNNFNVVLGELIGLEFCHAGTDCFGVEPTSLTIFKSLIFLAHQFISSDIISLTVCFNRPAGWFLSLRIIKALPELKYSIFSGSFWLKSLLKLWKMTAKNYGSRLRV